MDDDFKIEPEDIDEDMIEDDEPFARGRSRRSPRTPGGPSFQWQTVVPIVLLILILIVLFFKTGGNGPDEQLRAVVSGLEDRMNEVRQAVAELEKSNTTLSQDMDGLNDQFSRLAQDIRSLSGTIQELSKEERVPGSGGTQRYYEVRRGDTLYGIAEKNGLSLDRLLRLNGLNKNANIMPGQKLRVE